MFSLSNIFHPITAAPFRNNPAYKEISPCDVLKPYIRCFWGTDNIINGTPYCDNSIVTPDTCMDIIFNIDYCNNIIDSSFCGIDEHSHPASGACCRTGTASFGIRFYSWSAILFSDIDLNGTKNQSFDSFIFFEKFTQEIISRLWDTSSLSERIKISEKLLINHLNDIQLNTNFMNTLYYMLSSNGRARISDICSYTSISSRQLECICKCNTGISPKTLSSLIRYQLLWHDMLYDHNFHTLDAVDKFGYFDQAHLLKDFKTRHLMTPREAISFALTNQ